MDHVYGGVPPETEQPMGVMGKPIVNPPFLNEQPTIKGVAVASDGAIVPLKNWVAVIGMGMVLSVN
jgi:hypothetical protein